MATLYIQLPDSGAVTHELPDKEVTAVGWAPDNEIQIADPSISRHHAQIIKQGNGFLLKDLGSTNRSWVNGTQVIETELSDRDNIRFGSVECIFHLAATVPKQKLAAEATTLGTLVVRLQGQEERSYVLDGDVITIGWKPNNHIRINEPSVSGQHAQFILANGAYRLKDLNSTNKTYVNGQAVIEAEVHDGDLIAFGAAECVFKAEIRVPIISNGVKALPVVPRRVEPQTPEEAYRDQKRATTQINKELKPHQEQMESLTQKVSDITSGLAQAKRSSADADQIASLKQDRDAALKAKAEIAAKLEELEKAAKEREKLAAKLEVLSIEMAEMRGERDAIQRANEQTSKQLDHAVSRFDALDRENLGNQRMAAEIGEKLAQAETAAQALAKERDELVNARNEASERLEEAQARLAQLQQQSTQLSAQETALAEQLRAAEATLASLQKELADAGARKAELESKLAETEAKLAVAEQSAQVRSTAELEEYAQLKKGYAALQQELADLTAQGERLSLTEAKLAEAEHRVGLLNTELDFLKAGNSDLTAKLEQAQASESAAALKQRAIEAEIEALKGQRNALEQAVDVAARNLAVSEEKVAQLTREKEQPQFQTPAPLNLGTDHAMEISVLQRQRDSLQSQVDDLEGKLEVANREADAITGNLTSAQSEISRLEKEISEGQKKLGDLAARFDRTQIQARQQSEAFYKREAEAAKKEALLQSKFDDLSAKLTESEETLAAKTSELEAALLEQNNLTSSLNEQKTQVESLSASLKAAQELQATLANEGQAKASQESSEMVATLKAELDQSWKKLEELTSKLNASQAALGEITQQKEALAAERDVLQAQVADLQRQNALLSESKQAAETAASQATTELAKAKDEAANASAELARAKDEAVNASTELARAKDEAANASAELARAKDEASKAAFDLQQLREETAKTTEELTAKLALAEGSQARLSDFDAQIAALNNQLLAALAERDVSKQYIDEISAKLADAEAQKEAVQAAYTSLVEQSSQLGAELSDLKTRLQFREEQFNEAQENARLELERATQALEAANQKAEEATALLQAETKVSEDRAYLITTLEPQVVALQDRLVALEENLNTVSNERLSEQTIREETAAKLMDAEARIAQLSIDVENANAINADAFEKIAEATAESSRYQDQYAAAYAEIDNLRAHLESVTANGVQGGNVSALEFRISTLEVQVSELNQERDQLLAERNDLQAKLEAAAAVQASQTYAPPAPPLSYQAPPAAYPTNGYAPEQARESEYGQQETAAAVATEHFAPPSQFEAPAGQPLPVAATQTQQEVSASADLMIRERTVLKVPKAVGRERVAAPVTNSTTIKLEINPALLSQIVDRAPEAINGMRRCLHAFIKNQSENTLLIDLHKDLHQLSEETSRANLKAANTMSFALESLIDDLMRMPGQINPSTLRTVSQSLDFLAVLLEQQNLTKAKDPFLSNIFAVDDDSEARKIIRSAMEMVKLKVTCAEDSKTTLMVLNEQRFNLIFIDVGLPEMTGFDLCTQIRKLPEHKKTPVVFLTGAVTVQNRVQSSLSGGNDFIAKPFNLMELGVKALTWIFKGQLGQL